MQKTPLTNINSFFKNGIELKIKRNDLFPFTGGGNKARKIGHIIDYAIQNGYNALVSNGGIQSNHARATALAASEKGLKCKLVLHTNSPEKHKLEGNLLLMHMTGAQIEFVPLEGLSDAMDKSMKELEKKGYKPLYIWGGGHCVQGSLAYYDAAKEAISQLDDWIPDYVIHASGTGTTQAGLIAGFFDLPTKVIGISVAREKKRGTKVVHDSLIELGKYFKKDFSKKEINFRDDWIFGGYENYTKELLNVIDETGKKGLILDPTYTGKAYYGMLQMINSREITPKSKVLFWHTGGLLNLLSSPHYLKKTI